MIFDTHAHYDDMAFDEDREEILNSLKAGGIDAVVTVASSLNSTEKVLQLIEEYPFLFGAIGVHPESIDELDETKFAWLQKVIQDRKKKMVAIGEIGLDYYWNTSNKESQKQWFSRQLEIAKEEDLPVIIHSREAAKDTLDIIRSTCENAEKQGKHLTGVIHCFSYSIEMAREFLKLGFYLGIGGTVTFKNAKKLLDVVEAIPLERIVLETDCPYLAPVPNRGKRNSSLNLPFVAEKIAQLKNVTSKEVMEITKKNGMSLFRIPIELL